MIAADDNGSVVPSVGVCGLVGAFAGFVVGSVLALTDPVIVAVTGEFEVPAAELSLMMVRSVALLVPVFLGFGLLAGVSSRLIWKLSSQAYRYWLGSLSSVWIVAVFAYVAIRYFNSLVGLKDAIKVAGIALFAGGISYHLLRLLTMRLRQGRTRMPVAMAVALGLMLLVPLAAWLVLR